MSTASTLTALSAPPFADVRSAAVHSTPANSAFNLPILPIEQRANAALTALPVDSRAVVLAVTRLVSGSYSTGEDPDGGVSMSVNPEDMLGLQVAMTNYAVGIATMTALVKQGVNGIKTLHQQS